MKLTDVKQAYLDSKPISAIYLGATKLWPPVVVSDADALAFIAAAGLTDETQQGAINTLVADIKAAGIWDRFQGIYPFVGGTAASHKFNLKDPRDLDAAYRLVFVGSWTHSAQGIKGSGGTTYANTFLNPSVVGSNQQHHLSAYVNQDGGTGIQVEVGVNSSGSPVVNFSLLTRYSSNGTLTYDACSGSLANSISSPLGYSMGVREGGTSAKIYRNGALLRSGTPAIAAYPAYNIYIGARNKANASTPEYSTQRRIAFTTIGIGTTLSQTEASALYAAVQKYQTTLARQV